MRETATSSQDISRPFDTMEFPRVAHIVADLDELEGEDRHPSDAWLEHAAPSEESSLSQAWAMAKPFAELWARPVLPARAADAGSRRSQDAMVYSKAPALRHTLFARVFNLAPVFFLAVLGACASTGATFRSGVGDAMLEAPPYYAGAPEASVRRDIVKLGHLPVMFQHGASQPASFDPPSGEGSELAGLLAEMNAYLATLRVSTPIAQSGSAAGFSVGAIAPDVQFGCVTEGNLAGEDCVARGDSALGRGRQTMRLAVGRPSPAWSARTRTLMANAGTSQVLVISLELGQYLPKQSGWRGSKSVVLGTNHEVSLPWLTSLETPVAVLQITGAIVDSSGKALRIGAEGISAHRTRLLVSALGAQEVFGDEQVRKARSERRLDLSGEPLAWQIAMRDLVVQLTGQLR